LDVRGREHHFYTGFYQTYWTSVLGEITHCFYSREARGKTPAISQKKIGEFFPRQPKRGKSISYQPNSNENDVAGFSQRSLPNSSGTKSLSIFSGGTDMAILKRTLLTLLLLLPSQIAWAQSPHSYFDWLAQKSEKLVANSYRTQTEIELDTAPGGRPNAWIKYDPNQDAAKITLTENKSGLSGTGQLRPSFDNSGYAKGGFEISTGNLLITWDAKWGSGFLDVETEGLTSAKTFMLSRMGSGDTRRIEIRSRFSHSDPSYIAESDIRRYIWGAAGDPQPMGRGGCPQNSDGNCQINGFAVQVDTWTRYWCFVDFANGTYSFWMADENTPPVKLFDKFAMDFTDGLNAFWFAYNSSASRTGPEIYAWFRNFAVLHNVSNVEAMVAMGANAGAGLSEDTTPPSPPNNLAVN
jgi:hypothetical protein